jgi:hypothetical protein
MKRDVNDRIGSKFIWLLFIITYSLTGCGVFSWPDEYAFFGGKDPDPLEYEYMYLAWFSGNQSLCLKISDKTVTTAAFNSPGTRAEHMRSSCFSGIASNTKNPKVCDNVKSISTLLFSGSALNRDSCIRLAGINSSVFGSVNYSLLLARMNLRKEEIDAALVRQFGSGESDFDSELDYWQNAVQTPEFLTGIDRLPNF